MERPDENDFRTKNNPYANGELFNRKEYSKKQDKYIDYLESKLKKLGLFDVSKRASLFEAARDVADLSGDFEPKNDEAFNAMVKLILEVCAIEDIT